MKRTILVAITLLLAITLQAQKRVNNRMYNPDPAPVVSGDRLYVFTGHDLDTATYFRMPDWQDHRQLQVGQTGRQCLGFAGHRT